MFNGNGLDHMAGNEDSSTCTLQDTGETPCYNKTCRPKEVGQESGRILHTAIPSWRQKDRTQGLIPIQAE
jgi:hypothetical protein